MRGRDRAGLEKETAGAVGAKGRREREMLGRRRAIAGGGGGAWLLMVVVFLVVIHDPGCLMVEALWRVKLSPSTAIFLAQSPPKEEKMVEVLNALSFAALFTPTSTAATTKSTEKRKVAATAGIAKTDGEEPERLLPKSSYVTAADGIWRIPVTKNPEVIWKLKCTVSVTAIFHDNDYLRRRLSGLPLPEEIKIGQSMLIVDANVSRRIVHPVDGNVASFLYSDGQIKIYQRTWEACLLSPATRTKVGDLWEFTSRHDILSSTIERFSPILKPDHPNMEKTLSLLQTIPSPPRHIHALLRPMPPSAISQPQPPLDANPHLVSQPNYFLPSVATNEEATLYPTHAQSHIGFSITLFGVTFPDPQEVAYAELLAIPDTQHPQLVQQTILVPPIVPSQRTAGDTEYPH